MAADGYYNSNALLLHGDGANNSTTFTDHSPTPKTFTVYGNAKISTTQSKWGGASMAFDGSGDYIKTPDHATFTLGSGDGTIEGWFWESSAALYRTLLNHGDVDVNTNLSIAVLSAAGKLRLGMCSGSTYVFAQCATAHTLNAWHHFAFVKQGAVVSIYLDGVFKISGTAPGALNDTTAPLTIGASLTSAGLVDTDYGYWEGYLDDIRITQGVARYTAAFTPPTEAFANEQSIVGTVSINLPVLSLYTPAAEIFGATTAQLPSLSTYITGHDATGDNALDFTLPSLTTSAQGGANASTTLPSLSSQATGTVTNTVRAALSLPSLTSQSRATVAGMANAALSLPSMSSTSYAGALCSVTIGSLTAQATGTTGSVGGAQVTLPLFQAEIVATVQNKGSSDITLPSLSVYGGGNGAAVSLPSLILTAIGTAVVTASYEAYAVNLKHTPRPNTEVVDEVTRYTNYPFTHVVRYQNSYYGANSTGLYLLEGTTDDATPIPWAVKTAMTDFKSTTKKTLASAYFGGRFGPASTIKLHAGEQTPNSYSFSTPRDALAQNHRQVFGKGVKERYYALEASGTGVCELDSIELDVHNLTRRI